MGYFDWNDRYLTGIGLFDDQHKRLFALVNAFHQAMKEGKARKGDEVARRSHPGRGSEIWSLSPR